MMSYVPLLCTGARQPLALNELIPPRFRLGNLQTSVLFKVRNARSQTCYLKLSLSAVLYRERFSWNGKNALACTNRSSILTSMAPCRDDNQPLASYSEQENRARCRLKKDHGDPHQSCATNRSFPKHCSTGASDYNRIDSSFDISSLSVFFSSYDTRSP